MKTDVGELDDEDKEIKHKSIYVALVSALQSETLDITRFSDWTKVKRVAGWIVRFAQNLLKEKGRRVDDPDLQLEELATAEQILVKDAQQTSFPAEVDILKEGGELPDSNKLSSLSPYLDDDGVLRVGGRLNYIPIPLEARHPAILPRCHDITRLIIEWLHKKNGHVGCEHVLSLLLQKYWVMSARTAIKTALRLCFFCKVRRAQRLVPRMADLPEGRAAVNKPAFDQCGVDLFGPVIIKEGRKRLKRWVVLFTCLTVRCIHLEVVETAETDTFINSLRRFTNRRGCPSTMYSDQGNNFRGASAELKEFISNLDQGAIKSFATSINIKWLFNPPKSPHMGGIWERLVRSVKEVMLGVMKDHVLTDPQLYTVLTEVESIVNSRPLTHVSNDVDNLEPLTPNHLLLGKHLNWSAIVDTSSQDVFSRRKWKQVQGIRSKFWARWTKEYLPTLNRRTRWRKRNTNFNAGELVLLKEDE